MSDHVAIGIDLGGTNLRVGVVNENGQIMRRIKTPSSENILELILDTVNDLFTKQAVGIGIGVAGLIDRSDGKVLISPNLHVVEEIHLVKVLREKFNVPVIIENDANAAAIGEMWVGAGRKYEHFVLFTLGTGIGGGLIYNRRLLNVSAEIGHMSINTDGEKCHCGNNGCLESYASARAILTSAVEILETERESLLRDFCGGNVYKLTPEDIYKAALDGDVLSRELLKNAGRYLGIGIANMINMMSPDAIILAGGLIGAWEIYAQEAIREASKRAFKELFGRVDILPAELGDNAGLIGSARLVLNRQAHA